MDEFEMPEITSDLAKGIVANTPDDEIATLYMAAWHLWRAIKRTNDPHQCLKEIADLGAALDVEYEAPLIIQQARKR